MKYKMYIAKNDVILMELINGEYKRILHLSSIEAINIVMLKKGVTLNRKNCKYIMP